MYQRFLIYFAIVPFLLLQTCQRENPVSWAIDDQSPGDQVIIHAPGVKNVTISEQVTDFAPVSFIRADQNNIRSYRKSWRYNHIYCFSTVPGGSAFGGILTIELSGMKTSATESVFIYTITDSGGIWRYSNNRDTTQSIKTTVCTLTVTSGNVTVHSNDTNSSGLPVTTLPYCILKIPSEADAEPLSRWSIDSIETGSSRMLRLKVYISNFISGLCNYSYLEGLGVQSIEYHGFPLGDEFLYLIAVDDEPVDTTQFLQLGIMAVSAHDSLPEQISCFSQSSPQHLFAFGHNWGLRSSDAGDHWDALTIPYSANSTCLTFINDSTGFYFYEKGIYGPSIMMTANAGSTWRVVSGKYPHLFDGLGCIGFQFTDSLHGYCMSRASHLITTVDGGLTWNSIGVAGTSSESFFFIDNQSGWKVGNAHRVLYTQNGGETWTEVNDEQNLPTSEAHFSTVVFTDRQTGYLSGFMPGKRMLYRTTDGGTAWTLVHLSDEPPFRGIFFKDPANGIASDVEGKIYTTADSAVTWLPTLFQADGEVRRFNFSDNNNGWALTSSGTLMQTEDGGTSWTALNFVK